MNVITRHPTSNFNSPRTAINHVKFSSVTRRYKVHALFHTSLTRSHHPPSPRIIISHPSISIRLNTRQPRRFHNSLISRIPPNTTTSRITRRIRIQTPRRTLVTERPRRHRHHVALLTMLHIIPRLTNDHSRHQIIRHNNHRSQARHANTNHFLRTRRQRLQLRMNLRPQHLNQIDNDTRYHNSLVRRH